ncbi:MAG: hypothetical protein DSZ07_00045 [Sulfurovum sp.]|nr:MAG: hypothetical protein DSZ07_00045 [Sulfurovum sp.]
MKLRAIVLGVFLLLGSAFSNDKGLKIVSKEMQTENRVALVIGNNAYQRPLTVLNNTINDAQAIRAILVNRGFEVIYKENVSHRTFDALLEKFYRKLSYGGVGLLYFSGHGLEFDGQNYLIPTDAKIRAKSDTQYEAIALNKITHRIQKIGNRLNIIILDACRNDPFAKAYGVGGLSKAEPIGLFVSYATGAGKVSSDGRVGGNGLFTQYLIENMKKPLTLQQVFKKTRASVYDASGGTQFPAIYDQIVKGDFYFTLPQSKPTPNIVVPQYIQPQPIVVQPSTQTSTSKWIDPTESVCKDNGGEIGEEGICEAPWKEAKKICSISGGSLPSLEVLGQVVTSCRGILNNHESDKMKKNRNNNNYQSCYKRKGFNSNHYWSSASYSNGNEDAWVVYFYSGYQSVSNKGNSNYVRCVRAGQ